MKAFLAAAAATIVIAVGAWAVFGTMNTAVDEVTTAPSVRLK